MGSLVASLLWMTGVVSLKSKKTHLRVRQKPSMNNEKMNTEHGTVQICDFSVESLILFTIHCSVFIFHCDVSRIFESATSYSPVSSEPKFPRNFS